MSLLGGILSVGGALLGAGASRSAANAQSKAAEKQLDLQREMFDYSTGTAKEYFQPFYDDGRLAMQAYNSLMGLGPAPTVGGNLYDIETVRTPGTTSARQSYGGFSEAEAIKRNPNFMALDSGEQRRYLNLMQASARAGGDVDGSPRPGGSVSGGSTRYRVNGRMFDDLDAAKAYQQSNPYGGQQWQYEMTPAAQIALREGVGAIEGGAAGRGNLFSGNTLKRLEGHRSDTVMRDRDNVANRLLQIGGMGQGAAGSISGVGANAANSFAQGGSQAYANQGDAQAAGYMGMANAVNSGLNNWMAYNTLNRLMA